MDSKTEKRVNVRNDIEVASVCNGSFKWESNKIVHIDNGKLRHLFVVPTPHSIVKVCIDMYTHTHTHIIYIMDI